MKTKEKILIFFTFLFTCVCLAFLVGSLASQHWIVSSATRPSNPKSEGRINFGLFVGTRRLNHGFGERVYDMNVIDVQYRESQFMIRELYVTTIACVCSSILFGIISAGLSLYNTSFNPSEAVCNFPGLIAFNIIGCLLSLTAVITWLIQFFMKLRKNVLIREDISNGGWNSEGQAAVGYSFWMVFGASAIFFVNSVIFLVLNSRLKKQHEGKRQIIEATTKPNGNLMLY